MSMADTAFHERTQTSLTRRVARTIPLVKTPNWQLPIHPIIHQTRAGINPIVDLAHKLLSLMGILHQENPFYSLPELQTALIDELNQFQESAISQGHTAEFVLAARLMLCLSLDDIISNAPFTHGEDWDSFSLIAAFHHDARNEDALFNFLEHIVTDPKRYIDLMELIYFCLSMGYQGPYRTEPNALTILASIRHHLYQHIRAYRGHFSKTLSPSPLKIPKITIKQVNKKHASPLLITVIAACIIMVIFISLSYLMDAITNEAYSTLPTFKNSIAHEMD